MSHAPTDEEVIATLQATPVRRIFAYAAVFVLGAMLILLAFIQPPAFGWQVFLIALGAGALFVAERLRRATMLGLVLTEAALRDTGGRTLVELSDIRAIDRGALAFKPSNGFVLHLHSAAMRTWAPGLWWRFGKRVGVGGVTPSGPAKFMAEQIAMRIKD
ncbi:hypothetical protein [Pseudooctadecabacter sp.]|uniref:hypothetical protein n=1 Tax=Pseudooctadecabacter sp. TaxID=1966338 RepID=UPI0035C802A7